MSQGGGKQGSIFGGLLLILLGVTFLLAQYDPGFRLGHWIARFWPLLLIVWGLSKLVEHLTATRGGGPHPSILTAGEALLLAICAIVFFAFVSRDWLRNTFPRLRIELPPFSQRYSQKSEMPPRTIPAGAHVIISTERGDIQVKGSDGSDIRVNTNESGEAASAAGAKEEMKDTRVVIEQTAGGYSVHPINQTTWSGAVTVDLSVEVPKSAILSVSTGSGDIQVRGVTGDIAVQSGNGDINIRDAGGNVGVAMGRGDLAVANAAGDVRVAGRGDDAEISNVGGDATIAGDFYGSINVQNVGKLTKCSSQKSEISIEHLSGKLSLDSGDIAISQVGGAARLTASNKDIEIKGVDGSLNVANSHGDISVTYFKPPQAEANIADDSGNIEMTLPASSNVSMSAASRSGEVESDFNGGTIQKMNDDNMGRLSGQIGSGGPAMHVATSYGTIRLHKTH